MDSIRRRRRSSCLVIHLYYCFFVFFYFFYVRISHAQSTLKAGQEMRYNESLVSPNDERFKLLFFGSFSALRPYYYYLGIKFMKDDKEKLVWVANRENPLRGNNPILNFTQEGNLVISSVGYHSDSGMINTSLYTIYSKQQPAVMSNSSSSNTTLTLLDTGNLVIRAGDQTIMWQSFDYISDTLLPGMKLGVSVSQTTGKARNQSLTSWMYTEDPTAGAYTLGMDPNNTTQLVIWKRGVPYWRSGIWNGIEFTYFPFMGLYYINIDRISNENESYYTISPIGETSFVYTVLNSNGSLTLHVESVNGEQRLYITNCIDKNEEISPGCVMLEPSNCKSGDDFPLTSGLMSGQWDYLNNINLSLSDCMEICMNNCSCTAYASAQSDGTGCRFSQGQKLENVTSKVEYFYMRDLPIVDEVRPRKSRWLWLIISGPVVSLVILSVLSLLCYRGKGNYCCLGFGDKKKSRSQGDTELIINELGATLGAIDKLSGAHQVDLSRNKDPKLNLYNFSSIQVATDNFSDANKLGQGGFGPVYKGKLVDGQEIAVKRLSRTSGQGLEEFKNELILISKLQHRNLVRVLGCCIQGEERILIYEFLPNKSLDYFLFDATKRALLDWKKRISIIEGIAQGLLYLHKYSRLKIIHRDLKSSNILLDSNMNPKISDFGTARIFGEDESQANTIRIAGTYGYMSPEYAVDGLFSVKSDVFSFGVMILEIVSGKKNTGFYQPNRYLNLLSYAWDLWKDGRCLELMDQELLDETCSTNDVMRCVQVGLLCVQEKADDRPTMSDVVSMLSHELVNIPAPKQPAFSTITSDNDNTDLLENPRPCSINYVTTSEISAR